MGSFRDSDVTWDVCSMCGILGDYADKMKKTELPYAD